MSYIRTKMINGNGPYYYEVRSERDGDTVRQIHVQYLGTSAPVRGAGGEWEATSEIGGAEPVVPKQKETIEYGGATLERQEDFSNGSRFYVEPDVDAEDVSQIRDSFERLPPRMQKDTPSVQIFSGSGKGFKVGEKEFETWGHWSRSSGAVRVWVGGTRTNTPARADALLAHEVTHSTFDRYSGKYGEIEKASRPGPDEVHADFTERRKEIDERYAPKLKEKEERLDAASKIVRERRDTWMADSGQNHERADRLHGELESAKKASSRAQADYTRVYNRRDKERAAYRFDKMEEEYNRRKERNLDSAIDKEGPNMRAWVDFFKASEKEGGLTNYSDAYRTEGVQKVGGSFHNENLAEATSIWYTVPHRVYMAQPTRDPDTGAPLKAGSATPGVTHWTPSSRVASSYPRTHAAYFRLMDTESEGHVVSLKNRPRGWVKEEVLA